MANPPLQDLWTPEDAQRLTALYQWQILDSEPEPEFDALVRQAAHALNCSRAFLATVDAQRVWVKARYQWRIESWPRLEDACALQLPPSAAPRVIEATAPDQWPFCSEAPDAFVAAAPWTDEQGVALGWLAVLSPQSRPEGLSPADAQALHDFALMARSLLLARTQREDMAGALPRLATMSQFKAALDVELRHAMRTGEPFTALRMDLDGLDMVRHGFGDGAAHEVLLEVSRRLAPQVRTGDVLARVKAESFGVLMRHGGEESAEVLASRMVACLEAPLTLRSGDEVGVGISIGMAAYDDTVGSVDELLDRAEEALAEAHEENKQHWKLFDVLQQRSRHLRAQRQEG